MSEIDDLKKEIRELREKDRAWFNESLKKQLKLNAANEQIATLKAELIELYAARYIEDAKRFGLPAMHPYNMARSMLAGKYPDIFGVVQ
jgi:hypothetical protein